MSPFNTDNLSPHPPDASSTVPTVVMASYDFTDKPSAAKDEHNIFNDGKAKTIRYLEWKDEMKAKARSVARRHGVDVLMGAAAVPGTLPVYLCPRPASCCACRRNRPAPSTVARAPLGGLPCNGRR